MSGRRDSNPLPTAWEAVALPGELLPLMSLRAQNYNDLRVNINCDSAQI
jgi:hypothetical protein